MPAALPLRARHIAVLLFAAPWASPALAQCRVALDEELADRTRLTSLLDAAAPAGSLLRAASTRWDACATRGAATSWDAELLLVHNSALPYSLSDGAMWAGRGANLLARAGAMGRWALARGVALDVVAMPEVTASQNRPFPIFAGRAPSRSAYSSPWHGVGPASADLPLRFGDEPLRRITPGQSSVTLRAGPVAIGAATESHWWGPGMRNALVLSDNAEGFPHLFLRTNGPLRVPGGRLEAALLAGTLTESRFFDTTGVNDYRSLSGFALTYRLDAEPGLTVGAARTVVSPAARASGALGNALDALTVWETTRAFGDTAADGGPAQRGDQLTSLFWRWAVAPHGLEVYGEWARLELPRSLAELLVAPRNTQGWTLGLQWARPLADSARVVRVHGEASTVEQSRTFAERADYPDFYTGRATEQGYTQRGQLLGAAIGPGASSQWLAGDYLAPAWRAGLVLGRIRWENDALYREVGPNYFRHDVSLLWGLRGGGVLRSVELAGELTVQKRLNYLFQNSIAAPGPNRTVDVHNVTLGLAVAPRPRAPRAR